MTFEEGYWALHIPFNRLGGILDTEGSPDIFPVSYLAAGLFEPSGSQFQTFGESAKDRWA